jgi:thiamine kinase-like enzyme
VREEYTSGWDLLAQVYEPDVANILRPLALDPQPLCKVLTCYPQTLVHGDFKVTNLAWNVSPQLQLVALDWQMAAVGLPIVDLGWYFAIAVFSCPACPELCIERYREHLVSFLGSRFDEHRWRPMLELGLLATAVRNCCYAAWVVTHDDSPIRRNTVRQKLPMWSNWVRAGVKWL